MTAVFLKLLNMSIAASWLVWPFSMESIFSLIPSAETVPPEIVYVREPAIHSGIVYLNTYVNPIISETLAPTAEASVSPMQTIVSTATVIWLVGVMVMVCYGIIILGVQRKAKRQKHTCLR